MADEPHNPPAHPGDAWLEEALLLAASELSAFRTIAQSERDRLLSAAESQRARLQALEQELRHKEQQHVHDQRELRALLDTQLAQREQAWTAFSEGLKDRLTNLAAAQEEHARNMEEQSELRQKLHALRAQLESAHETQAELERRLLAGEEAFGLAATELQKSRDETAQLQTRVAEVSRELSASAAHCAQLQIERRAQDTQLADAENVRRRLEDDLAALGGQLHELSMEREQLMLRSGELDALRAKHSALESQSREQAYELEKRKVRLEELSEESQQLRVLRMTHAELATRERDQGLDLEKQRARIEELSEDSRALAVLRDSYDELAGQAREQARELDSQRTRIEELSRLSRELDALRALHGEVELRAEKLRTELSAAQTRVSELERVREDLQQLQLEQTRLQRDRNELFSELERERQLREELEPLRDATVQLKDAFTQLEAAHFEQSAQLKAAHADALAAEQARALAEQRAQDATRLEEAARVRMQEAEVDVQAARRERDQVRAGVDVRHGELNGLQQQLADLQREMDAQTQTRFAMLDNEKQRSAKLKQELEQARAELAQLRAALAARPERGASFGALDGLLLGGMPPADDADSSRATLDMQPQRDVMDIPQSGPASDLRPPPTSGPSTVPLPNRPAANPAAPAPAPRRAGTSYKYTELAEEQIYIPSRLPGAPGKGSGGGSGSE